MKIGILSMSDSRYAPVSSITGPVNQRYANEHGYTFWGESLPVEKDWAETVWKKIPILRRWLSDFDWLMWIDADAMVMDQEMKLEVIIEHCWKNTNLIICRDYRQSGRAGDTGINCGAFLLRNCEWSHHFLSVTDDLKPLFIKRRFPEQEAMERVLVDKPSHVAFVPHPLLNQFWVDFRDGDFIVHHAGGSVEDKVKGLMPFLSRVKYATPDPSPASLST